MAKTKTTNNQKSKTKSKPKPNFFSTTLGRILLVSIPVLAALVVIFVIVFVPRYDISVDGANIESVSTEDGVKRIHARLKFPCDSEQKEGYLVCKKPEISGKYSSNKPVSLFLPNGVSDEKIEEHDFRFKGDAVSHKLVVIRADKTANTETHDYEIVIKDEDGREVLKYILTVETEFSEDELALLNKIPDAEAVAKALESLDTVDGTCIVTEENDPNGNLNKTGGYIAAVYFSDNRANLEMKNNPYASYKDICDQGTVAGGQIEVYPNEEDAKKRADYLGNFSGSILSSGDNYVYGTSVIRVSNEMTATQMGELKDAVVKALTE